MCKVLIKDLFFRYEGSSKGTIRGFNVYLREGELVVITGPTGSGKTTLCRILIGLIPSFYAGRLQGQVNVCGIRMNEGSIKKLRNRIMYIPQNPDEYILNITVDDELSSHITWAMNASRTKDVIKAALKRVGLEGKEGEAVFNLSEGEKQRLTLAPVFLREPGLILIDEAFSYIDTGHLEGILHSLIKPSLHDRKPTIVIVEKNPCLIKKLIPYSPRLILVEEGSKVLDKQLTEIIKERNQVCAKSKFLCRMIEHIIAS